MITKWKKSSRWDIWLIHWWLTIWITLELNPQLIAWKVKFGKKSTAQEKFITSKLSKWEDACQHMINRIALANELAHQEISIDDKTKTPTLYDFLSKVMTQANTKLGVNNFSVNIVEQKEFVPKGSKMFKEKRKFKSHRGDWKSNEMTYVKPNAKLK